MSLTLATALTSEKSPTNQLVQLFQKDKLVVKIAGKILSANKPLMSRKEGIKAVC